MIKVEAEEEEEERQRWLILIPKSGIGRVAGKRWVRWRVRRKDEMINSAHYLISATI